LKLNYYNDPLLSSYTGCGLVGVFDDKGVQKIGVWERVVIILTVNSALRHVEHIQKAIRHAGLLAR